MEFKEIDLSVQFLSMLHWLFDFSVNALVSVVTGAYTGLVVTKYVTFTTQRENARVRLYQLGAVMNETISLTIESQAQLKFMSLFLTEGSFLKAEGHNAVAVRLMHLCKAVEGDMLELWRRIKAAERLNDAGAVALHLGQITNIINGCSEELDDLRPDWLVILFGKKLGHLLGNAWISFCSYLEGTGELRKK